MPNFEFSWWVEISNVRAGRPLPSLFGSKRWSCDLLGTRLGKHPPGPLHMGKTTDVAMRNTLPCFLCFLFLFCINPWSEDMMSEAVAAILWLRGNKEEKRKPKADDGKAERWEEPGSMSLGSYTHPGKHISELYVK